MVQIKFSQVELLTRFTLDNKNFIKNGENTAVSIPDLIMSQFSHNIVVIIQKTKFGQIDIGENFTINNWRFIKIENIGSNNINAIREDYHYFWFPDSEEVNN